MEADHDTLLQDNGPQWPAFHFHDWFRECFDLPDGRNKKRILVSQTARSIQMLRKVDMNHDTDPRSVSRLRRPIALLVRHHDCSIDGGPGHQLAIAVCCLA